MEGNRTEEAKSVCPKLQVMICTYGHEGLQRVASASHPVVDGVEYLVSCQEGTGVSGRDVPQELEREDFRIIFSPTKGLSVNRNIALVSASAPLLLVSDDDTDYTVDGLQAVIDAFGMHPEADIIAFRYDSATSRKFYPQESVSLSHRPKGYFISSIEIAMRRESVQGKVWFNENFGVGAVFPSGEEDIFLRDCIDRGLQGIFVPVTIARHDGSTTSGKNLMLSSRPMTKGAVFIRLHPRDWMLRMLAHALREIPLWRKGLVPSPVSYCVNWLKGASMAKRMKVFPTPDCSSKYSGHE